MNHCEQVAGELIAYLDGRASAAERRKVESHAQLCAACHERVDAFLRLWSVLEEVPMAEPSLGFDARLRQRIAAEPRQRFWEGWLPAPRLAFAMSMLLVMSVWISRLPSDVPTASKTEEDYHMIKDLRVLEDYDVLSNFEALSELPPAAAPQSPAPTQPADSGTL
jgi:anti-sigma factor RsiW